MPGPGNRFHTPHESAHYRSSRKYRYLSNYSYPNGHSRVGHGRLKSRPASSPTTVVFASVERALVNGPAEHGAGNRAAPSTSTPPVGFIQPERIMSPVMVSDLDPPNTGVWQSNVERVRLRSFPGRHGPNAHPAPLEQRTATGSPGPGPAAG